MNKDVEKMSRKELEILAKKQLERMEYNKENLKRRKEQDPEYFQNLDKKRKPATGIEAKINSVRTMAARSKRVGNMESYEKFSKQLAELREERRKQKAEQRRVSEQ